jgi:6-pyruvoyltetrahydropterin/6-carboxytetrahydropterin synthase
MKLIIGVSETFDAAHYLPNHKKCGKVHGHTYKVEVEIEGELKDGMIMDFEELKSILRETIKKYDHNLINELIENPTCENLCLTIFRELSKELTVVRVRVWENPDKWAEVRV